MWVQILNPSETFGDIMVDYSYVECTSACITALTSFRKQYPDHRPKEIQKSIDKGKWRASLCVNTCFLIWLGCFVFSQRLFMIHINAASIHA